MHIGRVSLSRLFSLGSYAESPDQGKAINSEELWIMIAMKHCSGYVSADVPTTEQYGKQDVEVEVIGCHSVHVVSWYEDGTKGERNTPKLLLHENDNLR